MIKVKTTLFKHGKESVGEDPHSWWPPATTTKETIDKVHDMVLQSHHIKVHKISDITGILTAQVYHILMQELGMSKVSLRWVPHLLTLEQKCVHCQISKECLEHFKKNPDFMRKYVAMNETWIHYCIPERKEQSQQGKNTNTSSRQIHLHQLARLWWSIIFQRSQI